MSLANIIVKSWKPRSKPGVNLQHKVVVCYQQDDVKVEIAKVDEADEADMMLCIIGDQQKLVDVQECRNFARVLLNNGFSRVQA